MEDLNNPKISAYKPQRRLLPKPPGYRKKLNKAQRKQKALAEARARKRITRLHLVGLTNAAVIVMGLAAAAVVVMLVVAVMIRL
jgi:hypothetical protein